MTIDKNNYGSDDVSLSNQECLSDENDEQDVSAPVLYRHDLETIRLCYMRAVRCFSVPNIKGEVQEKQYYINGQDPLKNPSQAESIKRLIKAKLANVDYKSGGMLENEVKLTNAGMKIYQQLKEIENNRYNNKD